MTQVSNASEFNRLLSGIMNPALPPIYKTFSKVGGLRNRRVAKSKQTQHMQANSYRRVQSSAAIDILHKLC